MKPIVRNCFLFISLLYCLQTTAQQDINFSQFYELPLLRNPALAGIFNGNVRITGAFRNQWQSITTPYRTVALGTEFKLFKGLSDGDFMTTGFQVTMDEAGDSKLKRNQFFPVFNYHKKISEKGNTYISVAFMGGPVNQHFDPSALKFNDQFVNGAYSSTNPTSQTFSRTRFSYTDVSTGLSLSSNINENVRFYIGAGLFHFTRPTLSFMMDNDIRLNKKWVFNAGFSAYTSERNQVVFYADYFMQGGNRMAQGGLLYTHNFIESGELPSFSVSGGAVFRWKDAMIPVVKVNTENLSFGFSYDANISKLKTASNYRGGYELTLSYTGLWGARKIEARKVECPVRNW